MKKILFFILIALFAFPLGSFAAQTPAVAAIDVTPLPGQTLAAKQKTVEAGLRDMIARLTKLSAKTQLTINQLAANDIDTSASQASLALANKSLARAKLDVDAFAGITVSGTKSPALTLSTLKYTANTAESTIQEAKARILESLAALKASLGTTDSATAQ
ncbi:MAG: hypothetical protein V4478_01630 [Patescibacteria group bacterium]